MRIVWDWNGTLLDDLHLVLDAVTQGLRPHRREAVTIEEYRDLYTRPVKHFYDTLLGRVIGESEWLAIDRRFHDAYRDGLGSIALAPDAEEALSIAADRGASQSLLSMYPHDELVPAVTERGIAATFDRIDGLRGTPGDRKARDLAAHLDAVVAEPETTVLIGDTPDDAAAATAMGAAAVLYDGGAHHTDALAATGSPVAGSLVEAVSIALDRSPAQP